MKNHQKTTPFVDAHCHLFDIQNYNLTDETGVVALVAGYDEISNQNVLDCIEEQGMLGYLGFAPQSVVLGREAEKAKKQIRENIDLIIGVGEIGLDYKWAKTEEQRERQITVFEDFLSLAQRHNLPVVIHCRLAYEDTLDILSRYKVRFMMHCFSGSVEDAKRVLDLGGYLSFSPRINENTAEVLRHVEVENILTETDAPYLAKTPTGVKEVVKYIANTLSVDEQKVKSAVVENVGRLFERTCTFI